MLALRLPTRRDWLDRTISRLTSAADSISSEPLLPLLPPPNPVLSAIRADPAATMAIAGMAPDPWQAAFLRNLTGHQLLCCTRQGGKSQATAAKVLHHCSATNNRLALLFSPTLRQSLELLRKVATLYALLGRPVPALRATATGIEFANGSRVISLPDSHTGVVGYTATLVVFDEASRVSDELYQSCRPMLARTRGTLIALSTPLGKRGWFYEAWDAAQAGRGDWQATRVTAYESGQFDREWLERERREIGEFWFKQEYECAFHDSVGAVFMRRDIDAMMTGGANVEPLFSMEA